MNGDDFLIIPANKPARKKGLTIRRLMVLIALIAVAIVLERESRVFPCDWPRARQIQCLNNLKQLGLAIHTYETANGVFPIGTLPDPDFSPDCRLGWNYLIAPELEIRAPFADGELALACDDPSLEAFRAQPPYLLSCPELLDRANANYVGIAGLGLDAQDLAKVHPRAGCFGNNRVINASDIRDGASQTMMVAESNQRVGPWFAGGRATVRGLDPSRQSYIGPKDQFGGIHKGLVNVLMADGSVKILKNSIDPKVFEAVSTIAGGDPVPVEFP